MRIVQLVNVTLSCLATSFALSAQCQPHMPPPSAEGGITNAQGQPTTPGNPSAPSPASPAAPAPAGPAAPAPNGPTTPHPQTTAPVTPRLGGPTTGGRGMPLVFERGATSKDRLRIDWVHPVPPSSSATETTAAGPLPLLDALQVLWDKDDDRPLLVLRECTECAGSDDALLNRSLNNDRTMLLTKWFRTVRLPPHVTDRAHPFFNVFAAQDYSTAKGLGGFLPHVFLLVDPSAKPVFFSGTQTPSDLQQGMIEVLEQRYAKNPLKAVKAWMSVLDKFDTIDAEHRRLEDQLDEVRAGEGPQSPKAQKLTAQLERNAKDREENLARETKIRDLGLLPMSRAAFAPKVAMAK